jgi:ATP-dependent DNA helicase RecQ
LDSEALLFYSFADVSKMKRFVEVENNQEQTEIYLKKLDQMAVYGDLLTCRRKYLLNYFDETATNYCGNCDICLTRVEQMDGTVLAQKILSAVARLQERFGAGYVIDFLRGSNAAKIQEEHKQLKTFGIGVDVSKETWGNIIRDLIAQEYLTKSEGAYPVLKLTSKSAAALNGVEKVMITKSKETIEIVEHKTEYETELFKQLKDVRRKLATEENVPAYIVLSDAALLELATYLPHNKEEFSKISGFGQIKIEKYGKQFWEVVAAYCRDHNLASRIHLKTPKRQRRERREKETDTKQQSLQLFKQGHTIEKIAELRGFSSITIEGHLAFYIQQGELSIDQLMDTSKIYAIQKALDQVDGKALSPVKELLGKNYSYGEIRMTMAHLEKSRSVRTQTEVSA